MSDKEVMLIADDDEINRSILREFYDAEYEVVEACDGEETVEALEKYSDRIALLLLDIVMPKRNGYEVLEFMHYSDMVDRIPVIVITAMDKLENEILALEQGANDIITKPFEPLVVYQRVQNVMNSFKYRRDLEKTVQMQNETLELLTNGIPGGILGVYCEEGFPLFQINERMLKYLGFDTKDEFAREYDGKIENAIHPSDRQLVYHSINKRASNGDFVEIKYRMRCKNSNYIWIFDKGRKYLTDDGRNICVSVCLDVTLQTELQNKLTEEREELSVKEQEVISYEKIAPGGVFRAHIGDALEVIHGNNRFYDIAGYDEKQFADELGSDLYRLVHEDDVGMCKNKLKDLLRSNLNLCSADFRIITRDGNTKWVMICGRIMASGKNTDLYGFILDRTQQEINLEALKLQKNCMNAVLNITGDIIAQYDFLEKKYILSNMCSKVFNKDISFHAKPDALITPDLIHHDDIKLITGIYENLNFENPHKEFILRLLFSDGEYYYCNVNITVFFDSFKEPIKSITHITKR